MAAEDMTSKDSAVIGDDLVEALGFEPISTEAAGMIENGTRKASSAESATDLALIDEVDDSSGDDIEIVEAESADDLDGFVVDLTREDRDHDSLADAVVADAVVADAVVETDDALRIGDELEGAAVDADLLDVDDEDADVIDADALASDDEGSVDPLTDESESEVVADRVEPVVFFNNGVDTNTAPLPSPADLESELPPPPSADDAIASSAIELVDLDIATVGEQKREMADGEAPVMNLTDTSIGATIDTDSVDLRRSNDDITIIEDAPVEPPAGDVEPVAASSPVIAPARRRQKLRARKSRRVIRHIDPWSVLTFSVLFHLCVFSAFLLASVLVWNVAVAADVITNIENFILELGDYETFEINADQVFRAAALIAGMLTLASSVLLVLLTVVFNLISDLIGGIRVTVIEEETVRIPPVEK
jgi:hypothetical protein